MSPDVRSVFASLSPNSALCLECLTRKAARRVEELEPELDALGARFHVGHCGVCNESGPVFSMEAPAA